MGTSKSYLPKVTKNTAKTKINITNLIKTGNVDKSDCVKKVITPFVSSLTNDQYGIKNDNYIHAVSTIGRALSSFSSSGVGAVFNQHRDIYEDEQVKKPNELFNRIIEKEDYLSELEKSNLLSAIGHTLDEMDVLNLEDLNSIDKNLFFKTFIMNLIYSLFVSSYFEYVRSKTGDIKEANDFCLEIKKYIKGRILQNEECVVDLISNEKNMNEYVKNVIDDALSLL